MSSSMAVLILRPQVFLRRFVVIVVGVFETVSASSRRVAAAIVSRAGTWLLKPVSFFLAQMVGFGNREQITVNLHVVWRQRHAGCEKEEAGRRPPNMQQKRIEEKKDRRKAEKYKRKITTMHDRFHITNTSHRTIKTLLKTHTHTHCKTASSSSSILAQKR